MHMHAWLDWEGGRWVGTVPDDPILSTQDDKPPLPSHSRSFLETVPSCMHAFFLQ